MEFRNDHGVGEIVIRLASGAVRAVEAGEVLAVSAPSDARSFAQQHLQSLASPDVTSWTPVDPEAKALVAKVAKEAFAPPLAAETVTASLLPASTPAGPPVKPANAPITAPKEGK